MPHFAGESGGDKLFQNDLMQAVNEMFTIPEQLSYDLRNKQKIVLLGGPSQSGFLSIRGLNRQNSFVLGQGALKNRIGLTKDCEGLSAFFDNGSLGYQQTYVSDLIYYLESNPNNLIIANSSTQAYSHFFSLNPRFFRKYIHRFYFYDFIHLAGYIRNTHLKWQNVQSNLLNFLVLIGGDTKPIYLFGADGFSGNPNEFHALDAKQTPINFEQARENHRAVELSLESLRAYWSNFVGVHPSILNVSPNSTYRCYEKINLNQFAASFIEHSAAREPSPVFPNSHTPDLNDLKYFILQGLLLMKQTDIEASMYLREPILQIHDLIYKTLLPAWTQKRRS